MTKPHHLFSIGLALLLLTQGCSIYRAATAPSPVETGMLRPGMPRTHVMSVLGSPRSSDVVNGERTEMYEYVNGSVGASKLRILPYLAGDLLTFGIAELVFWPAELAWGQGSEERAVASYDRDDRVRQIRITKRDGTLLADIHNSGETSPVTNPVIGQSERANPNALERAFQKLIQQLFVGVATQNTRTIAVLPTEHVSGSGSNALGSYITEKLTYAVYDAKVGRLAERARLARIMDEAQLSHAAMFDETSAKRIGHMSGADVVIMSTYAAIETKIVEVNAKAVSVETGEILGVGTAKLSAEIVSTMLH